MTNTIRTPVATELYETLRGLLCSDAGEVRIEDAREEHGLYAVWVDDEIIGTGRNESEALADAVRTARAWQ